MNDDGQLPGQARPLPAAVVSALEAGKKIQAIKIVRNEWRLGLKEAKDTVENYIATHPALQSSFAAAEANARRSGWIFLLIAAAMVLLIRWFRSKS